jgi:O-antigen ligase
MTIILLVAFIAIEIAYGVATATLVDDWYLPVVAVGALIVALMTFVEPIWGLYLFVAAMFAEGALVIEEGPTGARLLGILVFGAWVAHSLVNGRFHITLFPPVLFGLAYVIWGVVSASWALDTRLVFERARVIVQSMALYILVINLVTSPETLQKLLSVVVVVSLVMALVVVYRALVGAMIEGRVDVVEISGYDPNEQAAGLLLGAGVLMGLFSQEVERRRRLVYLIAFAVMGLAVLSTGSRGGVVSLVAMLLLSVIIGRGSWQLALMALLVVSLALPLLPATLLERVVSIVTLPDRGTGRVDIWLVGLKIISAHPLLGVGWGNFGEGFDEYLPDTSGIRIFLPPGMGPHNVFLGALGELGVIGFALFSTMIVLSARGVWTVVFRFTCQDDRSMGALALGVALSLVGVLIASLFVDLRYRKYFWLLLALSNVVHHLSLEPEEIV